MCRGVLWCFVAFPFLLLLSVYVAARDILWPSLFRFQCSGSTRKMPRVLASVPIQMISLKSIDMHTLLNKPADHMTAGANDGMQVPHERPLSVRDSGGFFCPPSHSTHPIIPLKSKDKIGPRIPHPLRNLKSFSNSPI